MHSHTLWFRENKGTNGLLYGAGLRQAECLKLRVKDVDFAYRQMFIRDAKGGKDRGTMLPDAVVQPPQAHLGQVREMHQVDLKEGCGEVWLPHAPLRVGMAVCVSLGPALGRPLDRVASPPPADIRPVRPGAAGAI